MKKDMRLKDLPLDEIKKVFDQLKANDFEYIKTVATAEWMKDLSGDHNITAKAWVLATVSVLASKDIDLKKKD